MKRNEFTEEQIIEVLRENDTGAAVAELCRKHGMSSATLYAWRAKYGRIDVSEAKRLKALENENSKLKRLYGVTSVSGKRVVREMNALIARRGRPAAIVSDNGTGLMSSAVLAFTQAGGLDWRYIAPGKPTRNHLPKASGVDAGRMPQRASLLDEPRPRRRRRLDRRLQHRATTLGDQLHDTRRLRRDPQTATAIGVAPPRKLRTDAVLPVAGG